MAAKVDTMGVDFETNKRRTTNAPSIWDRLPYNIGMELHHCASAAKIDSNDYDEDDYRTHNSSFNCYQQLAHDTRQLSLLPPPPPPSSSMVDDDKKNSPFTFNGSREGNSQGPTRIPLPLHYTITHHHHHQYQQQQQQQQQQKHYLLPPIILNSNDKKIDRNFKYSKSITSITLVKDDEQLHEDEEEKLNTETDSLVTSSSLLGDDDDDLKLLLTSARLNHDKDDAADDGVDEETKDNRRTCTKKFPVDNRISNKKNLVIKFNESQSATTATTVTVRRKTPSSTRSWWWTLEKEATAAAATAAEESANGASDHHRDFKDDSDMTATTRILGTTATSMAMPMPKSKPMSMSTSSSSLSSSTATTTSTASTTMVGSTSRRLNCCPTASSSSEEITSSTFSSALAAVAVTVAAAATSALPHVLRKFHITMRKDKKTMTAATALYLILYIFTSAKCMAARQDDRGLTKRSILLLRSEHLSKIFPDCELGLQLEFEDEFLKWKNKELRNCNTIYTDTSTADDNKTTNSGRSCEASTTSSNLVSTYFIPLNGKYSHPTGMLYNAYHNFNRGRTKHTAKYKNQSTVPEEHNSSLPNPEIDETEYEQIKAFLKFNDRPWTTIEEKWRKTTHYRLKEIRKSSDKNSLEILNEWPLYKHADSFSLINIDFQSMYSASHNKLFSKQSEINTLLLKYYQTDDVLKNKDYKKQLADISLLNENCRTFPLFYLLSTVLTPTQLCKCPGKTAWRVSIKDSENAFLLHCTDQNDIIRQVEAQKTSNCTFPQRWEGSWFLSGYQQSIHIKGSQFSYRGKCAASDGNKYLIVDEKGCHRCLVIYEKHKNVLQYKESECEGDSMYMHQSNPSAMAMRSILKSDHRGGAHPNLNGHSRLSSSDQYIMRSNDDMNDYFCKGRETLQNLCDQIPGDALLYSLFRENAEPVKCPLKGPFVFTYNRGHGECKSPVSNIESCTEDSRLLLSFQACPDVQGTESTVEELTCLATWKDGNSRYLVGLVSHHHAISNEERYRCFVYEKISSLMGGPGILSSKDAEYKLAQSGDATCNGLDSAEVGSRIMSLRKPPPAERCDFPVWFKGPRHWHALMGNSVYNYHPNDGSMHIIKPNGYMETRALCEQINKQTATEMMAVVHYTTGCQSGFMCMIFYRRDTHVIEIQTGKQASRLEDACAPDHFDINKMPYITLLASNPDPQICPLEGLYHLRGAIGPPYISSRHKRNHNNNKGHTQHSHHHHDVPHKRHTTLSLHNIGELGHTSWHSNTRPGVPIRHRREANSPALPSTEVSAEAPPLSASSPLASPMPAKSSASASSSSLLLDSKSPLSVGAIETNDLNQKTHDDDDDDDTTSSLLLKLPPRQLNHDNVQSGRITVATDGRTNELKEDTHRQQKRHQDSIVRGIISSSSNSSGGSSSSRNTNIESVIQPNTTTSRLLAQRSRRDAPGCIVNYKAQRQLWIGCTGPNLIDVRPQCNEDGDEEYSCHGSWSENGTVYVIARHKGTKHGVCISYRPLEGTAAKLVIGDACYRGVLKPPEHHLVANLTVLGKCGDTSSAYIVHAPTPSIIALFLSLASVFLPILMFTNR